MSGLRNRNFVANHHVVHTTAKQVISRQDNKMGKNEKRRNLFYVNWYFKCVGVCFSWPNRCLDNFSSTCHSFDMSQYTRISRFTLHLRQRQVRTQFQRNANETTALNIVKFKETVSSIKFVQLTFVASVISPFWSDYRRRPLVSFA